MHQRTRGSAVLEQVRNQVHDLRVQDGGNLKVLARSRCAGEHEDAGADDGANAERGQRPRPERLFEPVLGLL